MIEPTVDPLAVQIAQLLSASDVDELKEVVARWMHTASSERERRTFENFGARLLELKQELARQPLQPTRPELEAMLTIMLRLAAQPEARAARMP